METCTVPLPQKPTFSQNLRRGNLGKVSAVGAVGVSDQRQPSEVMDAAPDVAWRGVVAIPS